MNQIDSNFVFTVEIQDELVLTDPTAPAVPLVIEASSVESNDSVPITVSEVSLDTFLVSFSFSLTLKQQKMIVNLLKVTTLNALNNNSGTKPDLFSIITVSLTNYSYHYCYIAFLVFSYLPP